MPNPIIQQNIDAIQAEISASETSIETHKAAISDEKDKIKKLNKALLALQEIDN